jgi:hypothetical protein
MNPINLKSLPNNLTATYTWNTEYAVYVHEGVTFTRDVSFPNRSGGWATIKAGTVYPARRWTEYALETFDFQDVFAALFERYGDIEKAFTETAYLLGSAFTRAISSPQWQWTDGGDRDIVDTGQLRASQSVEIF